MGFEGSSLLSSSAPPSFFSPRDGWPATSAELDDPALSSVPDSLLRSLLDENPSNFPTLYMLSPSPSPGRFASSSSMSPFPGYVSPPRLPNGTPARTRHNSLPRPNDMHSLFLPRQHPALPGPPALPNCCVTYSPDCPPPDADDCSECNAQPSSSSSSSSTGQLLRTAPLATSAAAAAAFRKNAGGSGLVAEAHRCLRDEAHITAKLSPHLLLHLSILQQLDASKEHCIIKLEDLVALQSQLDSLRSELTACKEMIAACVCKSSSSSSSSSATSSPLSGTAQSRSADVASPVRLFPAPLQPNSSSPFFSAIESDERPKKRHKPLG